jgi:hypothetical protein
VFLNPQLYKAVEHFQYLRNCLMLINIMDFLSIELIFFMLGRSVIMDQVWKYLIFSISTASTWSSLPSLLSYTTAAASYLHICLSPWYTSSHTPPAAWVIAEHKKWIVLYLLKADDVLQLFWLSLDSDDSFFWCAENF